jgi:hypothetical protein
MTELWVAVLLAIGVVLVTDLSATLLRKRARRELTSPRTLSPETDSPRVQDQGVARDQK